MRIHKSRRSREELAARAEHRRLDCRNVAGRRVSRHLVHVRVLASQRRARVRVKLRPGATSGQIRSCQSGYAPAVGAATTSGGSPDGSKARGRDSSSRKGYTRWRGLRMSAGRFHLRGRSNRGWCTCSMMTMSCGQSITCGRIWFAHRCARRCIRLWNRMCVEPTVLRRPREPTALRTVAKCGAD